MGGANEASQGVFWWKLGLTFTSTEAQTLEKFKHVFPVGVQILCDCVCTHFPPEERYTKHTLSIINQNDLKF